MIEEVSVFQGLLSNREEECLKHLAMGNAVNDVAIVLKLSPRTVEYYLNVAKRKLKCRGRQQLIKSYWARFMEEVRSQISQMSKDIKNELSKSETQG